MIKKDKLLCNKCCLDLPLDCFSKAPNTKREYQYSCKKCQGKANSEWQKNNKGKTNLKTKRWQENHREEYLAKRRLNNTGNSDLKVFKFDPITNTKKCSTCKEIKNKDSFYLRKETNIPMGKCLECRQEHWKLKMSDPMLKAKETERCRKLQNKLRSTPQGRINSRLSNAIWYALKEKKSFRSWENLVGFTAEELKNHLEKQFVEEMTWELFLEGKIHIDHVVPKSWFIYESSEDEQFKHCWSLNNLQPLWASENLLKNNKYAN